MKKVVGFFILLCFILLLTPSVHAVYEKKVNAGVLPYCYDQSGQAYFLLGKEPNRTWADFGGNAEKKDKNTIETAAREFSEETRNVFGKFARGLRGAALEKKGSEEEYKRASIEYIKPRIKVELTHPKGYYKMYLAEVDYIPEHSFDNAAKVDHYEKTEYEWISVDRFMERVREITNRFKAYYGKKKKRQIRKQIFDIFKAEDETIMKTIYPKLYQKKVKLDGEKSKGKEKGEYLPYLLTQ